MNGVDAAALDEEDAWEVAAMLVATERAVHPEKWVDDLRRAAALDAWDALPY